MKSFVPFLVGLSLCVGGCTSRPSTPLQRLFDAVGVADTTAIRATRLIIVPGYGCTRCLAKANASIRATSDTLYIVACRSEKEFRLMTGKRLEDFPNVFLDLEEVAVKERLVKAVPISYALERGNLGQGELFLERDGEAEEGPQTQLAISPSVVDWGHVPTGEERQALFVLTNKGTEPLRISDVSLSCECTEAFYVHRSVAPGDTLHLHVTFRSTDLGAFVREIYVHGNFEGQPTAVEVQGEVR